MKWMYSFFLLFAIVLACGCTGTTPDKAASPVPTPAVSAAATTPAGSAGTVLAEFSSAHPNTSLSLTPGPVEIAFQADGPQLMSFSITEGNGTTYYAGEDIIMNGPYAGSLLFGPPDTAKYEFNVTSNGTWTARIIRPDSTHPLSAPVNLSGDGAMATPFFTLEKGEYIFSRNETGLSSPLYELRFANGSVVMNADNACVLPCLGLGSPQSFTIITIPETGTYVLGVISRHNPNVWTASISAVPAIPAMGPGPVILNTT